MAKKTVLSIEQVNQRFVERLNELETSKKVGTNVCPEKPLHHYTSAEGLLGIVKNRNIWATNFRYLNDSSEWYYSHSILQAKLKRPSFIENKTAKAILESYADLPEFAFNCFDLFLSSFCEEDDLLSQWRGYGSSGGYNIGLKPNLPFHVLPEKRPYELAKVIYKKEEQLTIIESLLKHFDEAVTEIGKSCPLDAKKHVKHPVMEVRHDKQKDGVYIIVNLPSEYVDVFKMFYMKFLTYAACFKNEVYQEEKEWRLIRIMLRGPKFVNKNTLVRHSNGMIIPYIELHLWDKGLRSNFDVVSLRSGPNLNAVNAKNSLTVLAAKLDQPHEVRISTSEIP
ncbi:DUF2971 domain-containing protein [Singulisphaera rosea]